MCRLYGFRANEETKVECSLVHAQNALMLQSRADLRGRAHPHGWGLAFYHNVHPTVVRRASAAYEDLHFSETVERILFPDCGGTRAVCDSGNAFAGELPSILLWRLDVRP